MGLLTSIVSGGGGGGGTAPTAPESIVVGTGSYTVPALKFAVVSANTTSTSANASFRISGVLWNPLGASYKAGSSTGSSDSNIATITAGSTITTSISNPTGNSTSNNNNVTASRETTGFAKVLVNAIPLSSSFSTSSISLEAPAGTGSSLAVRTIHAGEASWIAQIYPV